jgi:hypothetical protein
VEGDRNVLKQVTERQHECLRSMVDKSQHSAMFSSKRMDASIWTFALSPPQYSQRVHVPFSCYPHSRSFTTCPLPWAQHTPHSSSPYTHSTPPPSDSRPRQTSHSSPHSPPPTYSTAHASSRRSRARPRQPSCPPTRRTRPSGRG